MIPKPLKIELFWFLAVAFLSVLTSFLVPKVFHTSVIPGFSLNLMDTYFSFNFLWTCFTLFTVLGVLVLLIRGIKYRFNSIVLNAHLICFLSLFIMLLVSCEPLIYHWVNCVFPSGKGWTVYPPLSALPQKTLKPSNPQWMPIPQLVLVGSIFLLALRTGKLIDVNYKVKASE
ncbi:MAG: hypothetical protein AB8B53_13490 [Flavobacteriales bacterium]